MWTALVVVYFISCMIVIFSQVIKINKIALKYGLDIFSKENGLTSIEKKIIVKAFLILFGYPITGFLLLGLFAYLSDQIGFKIYY